jgi:putative ABC transport system permease protein
VKYAYLIWRNLLRKKIRTGFTLLSILVAFVLFGYLSAINIAFSMGVDVAGADRLLTIHKVSLIQMLPASYQGRLTAVPGVVEVTHATWFGGKFQDRENRFPVMPVKPEEYLSLYPEFILPEDRARAWSQNRIGAIVGRSTAERYEMEIGDRVPIQGTIWRREDGSDNREFVIEGIYEGADAETDETIFFFQYDYFNEARAGGKDMVGWYVVRIDDPDNAAAIVERIDDTFANSPHETKTSTEKAFVQGFANQIGNIGAILRWVLAAVFFTILLVAGNAMAQSVRERTGELAVLKTLGFSNLKVLTLVLAESLVLAMLGGGGGLLIAWALVRGFGDPTAGFLSVFVFPLRDVGIGVVLVVLLGLATGLLPALRAMRLTIVDALRRV